MPEINYLSQGSYVELAGFLGSNAFFCEADGRIRFSGEASVEVMVHDGLLCAVTDGKQIISGGEDGLICSVSADGQREILHEVKGKWIDKVAIGPQSTVAFAYGKVGGVVGADRSVKAFESDRSIEGLAFAPKGLRLAVARYDGVELRFVSALETIQFLEWKGAHTDVTFSPDGKYVVSVMQENALHGWRLTDDKHMRMSGYPTKVGSFSWGSKGKWLATSGAPAAIVWPFSGKDGPMGKPPEELGSMDKVLVTCVVCHHDADMLAIGYKNGLILGARISDGKCVSLREVVDGNSGSPITSMGWDERGIKLAFGTEAGEAGIVDISA